MEIGYYDYPGCEGQMRPISGIKKIEPAEVLGQVSWFARRVGLGLCGLVIGSLIWLWFTPAQSGRWFAVGDLRSTPDQDLVTAIDQRTPARPISKMVFRQLIDLGSVRTDENRLLVTGAYGYPATRIQTIRQELSSPTFPLFGYTITTSGHTRLIVGQRRYLAVCVEIGLLR